MSKKEYLILQVTRWKNGVSSCEDVGKKVRSVEAYRKQELANGYDRVEVTYKPVK